jgi:GDPmannose 4,6-dehydratase
MKRAIVVGAGGQDGQILFEALSKDFAVVGLDIGTVRQHLLDGVAPSHPIDLRDADQVRGMLTRVVPDEVYYLAAHHHASEERPDETAEFRKCAEIHLSGVVHFLQAIRETAPHCRLFYAGSSQMFGSPTVSRQDETTPLAPRNAYAITKVAGAHACAAYRERYGIHASVGILYNHESPLRGPRFVTQRIARGARAAVRNHAHKLRLGSLSSVVDWGYAPDFVDAMIRIVSHATPGDYVVATGEPHTVRDFAEIAFASVGLDWRTHVEEEPSLVRPTGAILVGDSTKLRQETGWRPTIGFEQLVRLLVDSAE